jgi:myo-inositol-1(or 4)-monophosphatase
MKNSRSLYMETAVRAVREAGKIQKGSFHSAHTVQFKSETDLVTEVDHACERTVAGILGQAFPDHDFLLEETLTTVTGSPYRWVVDPLDGTVNYAHRYPHFCCSIALQYRGETILGVVLDPVRDELFTAIRGEGAFLNGVRVRASEETELIRSLVGTGFPNDIRTTEDTNLERFQRVIFHVQSVRRSGSAALDLCYIASGRLDGYWVVQLAPWDAAAGVLMVEEAGGTVVDLTGGKHTDGSRGLVASNARIHGKLWEVLQAG